jgi:hypothetical protein
VEIFTINDSGNVGIGINAQNYKLHVRGTNPAFLRIQTDTNNINQVSGIEFGILAFASTCSSKITSTSASIRDDGWFLHDSWLLTLRLGLWRSAMTQ